MAEGKRDAAPGRRRADRQVDGSSVRARAHLPPRRCACFLSRRPSSPFGIQHRHHSRSSTGSPRGALVPSAPPSERSLGLPSSPSAPRHEVPGFGGRLFARPARDLDRRAGAAADLRSSARADRRGARVPSPSEPARDEPVDRRDFFGCRADPEGSESPFTPHRVSRRAWSQGEAAFVEGEKTWSPSNPEGDWVGTVARGRIIRTGMTGRQRGGVSRGEGQGGDSVETADLRVGLEHRVAPVPSPPDHGRFERGVHVAPPALDVG
jgi:hypothetical protein